MCLLAQVSRDVGLLFQQPRDQLFERTVEREVRCGLDQHPEADHAVEAALAAVGLSHLAGRHPAELPASQQRLLAHGYGAGAASLGPCVG